MERLAEFAGNNVLLIFALMASWTAVMFYEIRLKSRALSQVSSADALRIINKGAMIVDVRAAAAFGSGDIVHARDLGLDALASGRPPLKRKTRVLLTVCENGVSSSRAANALRKAGFESVYSLKGGLQQWRAENLPLVR